MHTLGKIQNKVQHDTRETRFSARNVDITYRFFSFVLSRWHWSRQLRRTTPGHRRGTWFFRLERLERTFVQGKKPRQDQETRSPPTTCSRPHPPRTWVCHHNLQRSADGTLSSARSCPLPPGNAQTRQTSPSDVSCAA